MIFNLGIAVILARCDFIISLIQKCVSFEGKASYSRPMYTPQTASEGESIWGENTQA